MATPNQEQPKPPIKGSWEDLLRQAQQLAARNDDDAVPIYDKLISRLSALTPERRAVSGGRLQNILVQACVNAQAYHSVHERYDQSLAVMDQMRQVVEEFEVQPLDAHRADIMLTAGRVDDAIALLREIAAENENDLEFLDPIFHAYIRAGLLDEAERELNEIQAAVAERTDESEDALARDQALIHGLEMDLAIERHQWQDAIDAYEEAVALDPEFITIPHALYMPLIRNGEYGAALPFVQQDKEHVIRSTFWEALALYHLGQVERAEELWTQVTETELNEAEAQNFNEVVLSFFYLGDAERMGLELLLRLINEIRNPNWSIFYLTGLGWAMHNNLSNARMNFDLALQQRRMTAQGTSLPEESFAFVNDLLDAEAQSALADYYPAFADISTDGDAPTDAEAEPESEPQVEIETE